MTPYYHQPTPRVKAVWEKSDWGVVFKAWTAPPELCKTGAVDGNGLLVVRLNLEDTLSVTNIHTFVGAAGSGFSSDNKFVVYAPDGTLLAQTADAGTTDATTGMGSTGLKTMALIPEVGSAPLKLPISPYPWVHLGYQFNATTRPQLPKSNIGNSAAAGFATFANIGLASTALRIGYNVTTGAVPSPRPELTAWMGETWLALS